MKIWLSRRDETTGRRSVVVDMERIEDRDTWQFFRSEVLRDEIRPRRTATRELVRYRVPRSYLDRLLLAFPFAELSPGIQRHQTRAAERAMGEIVVPDLDIEGLEATLYDFQKVGVAACSSHDRYMLNDDMGLGKTVQALATLLYTGATPALILSPNTAKWVWEREAERFTDFKVNVIDPSLGAPPARIAAIEERADLTVINFESTWRTGIEEVLLDYQWAALVVDEFHRLKTPTARQTITFHQILADRMLLMSGTPILNRPEEAWSALHKLWPERFPDYDLFVRWLTIRKRSRRGFWRVVGYKPDAMAVLRDVMQDGEHSLRRRKDQVLDDLPAVVTARREVDLLPEQRRLYDQIRDEFRLALENGDITNVSGALPLITRLKQAAFSPELYGGSKKSAKINELKEIVEELRSAGHKAILFSQWSRATRIMERELADYNPAYVDGSVPGSRRMEQVDKFNNDEDCWLYIGTIGANQESITLDAASYVVFTDKAWTPMANNQAIARSPAGGLRGAGRTESITVIELFARHTIEGDIEDMLQAKQQTFNQLMERDGGAVRPRITLTDIMEML